MASKLIIKSHHPRQFRVRLVLLALLLLAAAWGLVEFGRYQAVSSSYTMAHELDELEDELDTAQDHNARLAERIAILERASQVDKQAYGEVERTLKQTQDEMLELKEEVAFYRGILAPTEVSSGLNIADLRLRRIGQERAYRFKLVLTQPNANEAVAQGWITLYLEGVQGANQVQLGLKDVTGGHQDKLKFSFKYFQPYEGDMVLPEGFQPSRVLIEVTPTSRGFSTLKKSYVWSDIIK